MTQENYQAVQRLYRRVKQLNDTNKTQMNQIIELHLKNKILEEKILQLEEKNAALIKENNKLKRKPSDISDT